MGYRPVIVSKPHLFPACCVNCGAVENSGRRYFVDLGFEINHMYDAFPDGAVYMCDICVHEYVRKFMQIIEEQAVTLGDLNFGPGRTNPFFDRHRELLDEVEQRTDENSSGTESDKSILEPTSF